jgi:hypothetical protein
MDGRCVGEGGDDLHGATTIDWTIGSLISHFEARLGAAQAEKEALDRKVATLSP